MATNITTSAQFEKLVKNNSVVVVDFTAKWCGPCRRIAPVFDDLAKKFYDVLFVKVDVDKCPEISENYNIRAMPTFVVVRNMSEVSRIEGADEDRLVSLVEKYSK